MAKSKGVRSKARAGNGSRGLGVRRNEDERFDAMRFSNRLMLRCAVVMTEKKQE
jgi:hypothetical protein